MCVQLALKRNYADIRQRVSDAAMRSGRNASAITIVGVAKYVDIATTRLLAESGCTDIGESRPQLLWEKTKALSDLSDVRWHLVGHLQRNKAKRTVPLLTLIHSVDNMRLLEFLDEIGHACESPTPLLLEVNISGDKSKHGFPAEEMEQVLHQASLLSGVDVRGLMTMATREGGVSTAQQNFAELRTLRETLRRNCPEQISLDELSMGMSGDFEQAIEEGATLIRVGSALFNGITHR